jgi:hypothetical protein
MELQSDKLFGKHAEIVWSKMQIKVFRFGWKIYNISLLFVNQKKNNNGKFMITVIKY